MGFLGWVEACQLVRQQGRGVGKQGGQVRQRNKMWKGAEAQKPQTVKEPGQSSVLRHGQRQAGKDLVYDAKGKAANSSYFSGRLDNQVRILEGWFWQQCREWIWGEQVQRHACPREGFLKSSSEMLGALIRKHLQKGEKMADFIGTLEEKQVVLGDW